MKHKAWEQNHSAVGREMSKWTKILIASKQRRSDGPIITREQHRELVRQPCYYCGRMGECGINGIDRVDPRGDYTLENCRPSCWKCNKAKWQLTEAELIETAELIVKKHRERCGLDPLPDMHRTYGGVPLLVPE